jgi:hypothetical protein
MTFGASGLDILPPSSASQRGSMTPIIIAGSWHATRSCRM